MLSLRLTLDEHPGEQTRNRGWVHAEQASGISSSLPTFGDHPNNLSLLLMTQLWWSPAHAPFSSCSLQTNFCAFPQHCAFELRKGPDHLHHRASGRRGCVD